MKLKNILYILCLPIVVLACKEEEIKLYGLDDSGVYFQYIRNRSLQNDTHHYYSDSIDYSFSIAPHGATDTILKVRLNTLGKVKNYPRPVNVFVEQQATTAVSGTHYEIDLSAAVIPAGGSEVLLPVRLLRAPDLLTTSYRLVLRVEDNEHFKVPFAMQASSSYYADVSTQISANTFKIIISEVYTEPWVWQSYARTVLGAWSITKYIFVNQIMDISHWHWQVENYYNGGIQSYAIPIIAVQTRNALQELADAGTPLREEDGSFVQLGDAYKVDYSAYD